MIKDRVYGKKIVAVILAMTIAMLPLCSCAKDGQANDELLGLTKDGIKYILDRKISKLSKISTSDFDDFAETREDDYDDYIQNRKDEFDQFLENLTEDLTVSTNVIPFSSSII